MAEPSGEASGAAPEATARKVPGQIVQLEESVINRIAAGEVVVRPANALKELMENCLDAGSSHIAITVKGGGLKMLRIEDDGHGIRSADMPILCERFTTSKLRKYEDLTSIGTFGFRGEALASISHVAHVTVTTMTASDSAARVAQYTDGLLTTPVRPCAGTRGTTIVAEDFFYNNPTRRQALSKDSIEHNKVLEVIQRYSLHYPAVSFSCRKGGSAVAELHTPGPGPAGAALPSTRDVVGVIYGQGLGRELFPFEFSSAEFKFSFKGLATGPNWTSKSGTFVLFINNRLVECSPLKRAIDSVYAPVLPRHQHPWVYLSLELDAATLDVNVHPTKNEVQFLNEGQIAEGLQQALQAQLHKQGGSRTFTPMPSLGGGTPAAAAPGGAGGGGGGPFAAAAEAREAWQKPGPKKVELNPVRVRTDHRQRSLESLLRAAPAVARGEADAGPMDVDAGQDRAAIFEEAQSLLSVQELRAAVAVAASADGGLSQRLNTSVYVGPVDHELVLLQCGSALCLVNLVIVAREFAYQRLLRLFGGPGCISLKQPLPLKETLKLGVLDPESGYDPAVHAAVDVDSLAARLAGVLEAKAELLSEYFMMELDDGSLLSVPNALGLTSEAGLSFEGLPLFLLRLAAEVQWVEERSCLNQLCRMVADFCVGMLAPGKEEAEAAQACSKADMAAGVNAEVEAGGFEDVVQAAMAAKRKRQRTGTSKPLEQLQWLHEAVRRDASCQWPAALEKDGTVLNLVALEQLYRVFERC